MTTELTDSGRAKRITAGSVFVILPDGILLDEIRNFCKSKDIDLFIGDPCSPDLIAVPYQIGIVQRYLVDARSWQDWIEFLREARGETHDHLLIIILDGAFSEDELNEAMNEFADAHSPVSFVFEPNIDQITDLMNDWLSRKPDESVLNPISGELENGSKNNLKQTYQISFRERLNELTNRFSADETRHKVGLDVYYKYRIQSKWFLSQYLGEDHLYTKELDKVFALEMDQYSVGSYLIAARGIFQALGEDLDQGFIQVRERL